MPLILHSRFARIGAASIAGGLIYLSTRQDPVWWAAWLAPIPLLAASFQAPRGESLLYCVGAALVGNGSQWSRVAAGDGILWAGFVLALQAAQWLFTVQRTRALVRQSRHWLIVFAFPALWAAIDTLTAALSPDGAAASLADSQVAAAPVLQSAAVAGTPGVTFIVSLFASLVAIAWQCRLDIERPLLAYGLPTLVLIGSLGGGLIRLDHAEIEASFPVGLAATALARSEPEHPPWSEYPDIVATLAAARAELVVLPAAFAGSATDGSTELRDSLGSLARDNQVDLLVGLRLLAGSHVENRVWLFSPSGALIVDHAEHPLFPGLGSGDGGSGGEEAVTWIGTHAFGVATGKEMDFPALGRAYAARGIGAMLVAELDAGFDDRAHSAPAILRGIEGGYSVIWAARDGMISISDRYGRVLAAEAPIAGLEHAPLGGGPMTPYARFGGWFGWLCIAASVATLVPFRRRKRR
jgi:apolipoprotein N-acyltransferase